MRRCGLPIGLGLALLILACSRERPASGPSDMEGGEENPAAEVPHIGTEPNILLITIDTIRRDHVGFYGYPKGTTPAIDQFAAQSVAFENALTLIPLTTPAHASIMTGLGPEHHLVFSNSVQLGDSYRTLAEILRENGYASGAFVSAVFVAARLGFGRGFDFFSSPGSADDAAGKPAVELGPAGSTQGLTRSGGQTTDEALRWIRQHGKSKFFAWVHLYDPHLPYTPPESYGLRFNPGYPKYLEELSRSEVPARAFDDSGNAVGNSEPGAAGRKAPPLLVLLKQMIGLTKTGFETLTPELVRDMIAAYDGEVSYADEQVRRLLAALKVAGVWDNTIVVITGDHGEILYEKRHYFGHHQYLYQGSLSIPLCMGFPGIAARKVEQSVTVVDILPTLLEAVGIAPPPALDGVSFWGLIAAGREVSLPKNRMVFTNAAPEQNPRQAARGSTLFGILARVGKLIARELGWKKNEKKDIDTRFPKIALLEGDWKLIRSLVRGSPQKYRYELYNLKHDPGEEADLAVEVAKLRERLQAEMEAHLRELEGVDLPSVEQQLKRSRQDMQALRSLGYAQ